ncbi:MAG TPA: hypothetical protein VFW39_04755 [Sphingomicrobium sp.]|nr:hypothetical protein [Sphingomicrobium sp.]
MPHRRKPRKGSFGGHFDELVKHFPQEQRKKSPDESERSEDERSVHDRLFERAWSKNEEERRPSS